MLHKQWYKLKYMEAIDQKILLLEQEINDERKRLSPDRLDISFGELINLYKNNELIIRPEYQRLYRWSPKQKTALIESILLSIPIPPIFVAEDKNGVWELVDGLQRVATFISFFGDLEKNVSEVNYPIDDSDLNDEIEDGEESLFQESIGNKWALEEGGLIRSLEGFTIDTLPSNLKINLKRAVCRVEILRGESSTSMKYELFKRLNSGGSKLTPQEIRNAIYRGVNPRLNEMLLSTSQSHIFKYLTQLSATKLSELYDQELVLRFFAFLNNADNINENTENFLNRFMDETVRDNEFRYDHYQSLFNEVLEMINNLEEERIFRNERNLFVPAYFEGITIGLAQNIDNYRYNLPLLKAKIEELKGDPDFKKFSGSASNSKSRIKTRLSRANQIFQSI